MTEDDIVDDDIVDDDLGEDDLGEDDLGGDDLGGDDLGGDNLGGDNTGGDDLGGDNLGGDGTGGDDLGPLGPDDPVEGDDGVGGEGNADIQPEPIGPASIEEETPPMSDRPRGLPARAVKNMIKYLRRAANHRRNSEQELLKVGSILAKNGFVGRHMMEVVDEYDDMMPRMPRIKKRFRSGSRGGNGHHAGLGYHTSIKQIKQGFGSSWHGNMAGR